jgi:type IV pilus assembly protein PilY1
MKGTIWPNVVDPFVTAPTWPTPVSNTATMIDDLWHATINGRGQMYLATTRRAPRTAIQAGLQDILSQTGAQGGVAVSTVNLQRGDSRPTSAPTTRRAGPAT